MKRFLIAVFLSSFLSGIAISSTIFNDSVKSDFKDSMLKVNLSCGLRPLPPLGCQVGACMCDQNGNNCQWTFICR